MRALGVPYDLGRRDVTLGLGARRIAESLGLPVLDLGPECAVDRIHDAIASYIAEDGPALLVTGNCSSCLGTFRGLNTYGLSVLWFDAHGDYNTPETSVSGLLDGMCLGMAAGSYIDEALITLIGTRDLDPGESIRLAASKVTVIRDNQFDAVRFSPPGRAYIHVDIDVIDRRFNPGVNAVSEGGIALEQLLDALKRIRERCDIAAACIANYNPERDRNDRTLHNCLRAAEALLA